MLGTLGYRGMTHHSWWEEERGDVEGLGECHSFGRQWKEILTGKNNTWHNSQMDKDYLWHILHLWVQRFSLHFMCLLSPGQPNDSDTQGFLCGSTQLEHALLNTPICNEHFLSTNPSLCCAPISCLSHRVLQNNFSSSLFFFCPWR